MYLKNEDIKIKKKKDINSELHPFPSTPIETKAVKYEEQKGKLVHPFFLWLIIIPNRFPYYDVKSQLLNWKHESAKDFCHPGKERQRIYVTQSNGLTFLSNTHGKYSKIFKF